MGLTHLSDRWARLNDLFHQASALPAGERDEFIRAACGDDDELRDFLSELVASASVADDELRSEIGQLAQDIGATESLAGQHVGAYLIDELIARGGMGEVYLASRADGAFEKAVAVKVVRKRLNDEEFARHFLTERQVLANLNHPCIPALADAGQLDDGRPYFVCEYVDGEPIDTYFENNALSLEQRLTLLTQVGEALQHAHNNLVLHLDIKPDNILVDKTATPRLLDFGVARLVGEREQGHKAFTPEFASPEQINGEPLSAASDVYSFGLLLYRTLSSDSPVGVPRFAPSDTMMADRARFAETLDEHQALRGISRDMRAIIRKATAAKPADRYGTIDALLRDLRHLPRHLPISARKQTLRYRLGKFLQRYRLMTAATLALIGLLVGVAVRETELRQQAEESARVAAREAETARQVSRFLTGLFEVSDPGEARGNQITVREILDAGAARIGRELADQPQVQSNLLSVIGDVYASLGLFDVALLNLQGALAIIDELPDDHAIERGPLLANIGNALMRKGRFDEAEDKLLQSLEANQTSAGPESIEAAKSLSLLGILRMLQSNYPEAEELHKRAIAITERKSVGNEEELANSLGSLAALYTRTRRLDDAEALAQRALAIQQDVHGIDHPLTGIRANNLANVQQLMGRYTDAIANYKLAIAIYEKVVGPDYAFVAASLDNMGSAYQALGRYDEAEPIQLRALAIREKNYGDVHQQVAVSLGNLGDLYSKTGRLEEAQRYMERSLAVKQQVLPAGHPSTAVAKYGLSEVYRQQGDLAGAESLVLEAIADWKDKLPDHHDYRTGGDWRLANIYRDQGRYADAAPIYERVFAMLEEQRPAGDVKLADMTGDYARFLRLAGRGEEADALVARMESSQ